MKHVLHKISLKSGAKLLAINVPGSNMFNLCLAVKAGYRFVDQEQFELPHLMEHLAFQGTKSYPDSLKLAYEIEKDGAYYNASTDSTTVRYIFESTISEMEDLIKLSLSIFKDPLFRKESIMHEKEVIINELTRKIDEDQSFCWYMTSQKIAPDLSPDITKRIEIVKRMKENDIRQFHQKTHTCKNLTIIMAGNFTAQRLKKATSFLNQELKDYQQGQKFDFFRAKLGNFKKKIYVYKPKTKRLNFFALTFVKPEYNKKFFPALKVLHAIYGRGHSSRIFQKARKSGLTYGVNSGYLATEDYTEFYIGDKTSPEKTLPLFELCIAELSSILKNDFTDDELERAIGFSAGRQAYEMQLPIDLVYWYGEDFLLGRKLSNPDEFTSSIKKVTRTNVLEAAKRYIRKDNWVLTLMGQDIEKDKEKFRRILDKYLK